MARRRRPDADPNQIPASLYWGLVPGAFTASDDTARTGKSISAHRRWSEQARAAGWSGWDLTQAAPTDAGFQTHLRRIDRKRRLIEEDDGFMKKPLNSADDVAAGMLLARDLLNAYGSSADNSAALRLLGAAPAEHLRYAAGTLLGLIEEFYGDDNDAAAGRRAMVVAAALLEKHIAANVATAIIVDALNEDAR
jgi:hypothetical protein